MCYALDPKYLPLPPQNPHSLFGGDKLWGSSSLNVLLGGHVTDGHWDRDLERWILIPALPFSLQFLAAVG